MSENGETSRQAMRALRWPDAFPKDDIAVRNNLGGVTPKQAEAISQAWRPWAVTPSSTSGKIPMQSVKICRCKLKILRD